MTLQRQGKLSEEFCKPVKDKVQHIHDLPVWGVMYFRTWWPYMPYALNSMLN